MEACSRQCVLAAFFFASGCGWHPSRCRLVFLRLFFLSKTSKGADAKGGGSVACKLKKKRGKKQGRHNCEDKSQLEQRLAKKTRRQPKHIREQAGTKKGGGAFCYFSEVPGRFNLNPAMSDCRCIVLVALYRLFCTSPQFYRMKQREQNTDTLIINLTTTNHVLVIIDILPYPIAAPFSRNTLLEIRMTAYNLLLDFALLLCREERCDVLCRWCRYFLVKLYLSCRCRSLLACIYL